MPKKLPPYLYHGTLAKNMSGICKEGILKGTAERCSAFSKSDGFVEDCIGNVSMAKDKKHALYFATIQSYGAFSEKRFPTQAIFQIDTSRLDPDLFIVRDMYGKKNAEYKYVGDVPNTAVASVELRKFMKDSKGGMCVIEQRMPCMTGIADWWLEDDRKPAGAYWEHQCSKKKRK
jgi:hypothetical protein